jgi:CRP-like cAMP-binding protein
MTIIDEMNEASREFYSNLNVLNIFLKREDVYNRMMKWRKDDVSGPEFCRRLRTFYLFKYANSKQYNDLGKILDNVSDDLRKVLAEAMYGDILRSCGVFRDASPDMIAHLAVHMCVLVYARGYLVYSMGEPATHLYFCVKGTVMLPVRAVGMSKSLDVYRQGGEPFGQEVVYKFGQPRSRTAVCSVETVLLTLDGEAIHYAIENFGGRSLRWRITVSRNLVMVADCMRKAVKETTRDIGRCDADAGIAYLEFSLGKMAMFHIDLSSRKENNLLWHFKRLTRQALVEQGLKTSEVERLLESFRKHEDFYDDCTQREIVAAEKFEDLRNMLDTIEDKDGETMETYFPLFIEEKIETIEALKKLDVCDLKAVGVPLGDALLIVEGSKTASSSIFGGTGGGVGNGGGARLDRGNVRKVI